MSWFLWSSWGGAIDYDCLRVRGDAAVAVTDGAGIVVNLLLLVAAPILGRWFGGERTARGWKRWLFLGTFWWALANYAEAFSYLVINTLWLTSDMRSIVEASRVTRWPWLAVGTVAGAVVARELRKPAKTAASILAGSEAPGLLVRLIFPLYVGLISVAMAAARITLT